MAAVNLTLHVRCGSSQGLRNGRYPVLPRFRKDQHRFARQVQTFADGTIGGGFNLLTDACVEKPSNKAVRSPDGVWLNNTFCANSELDE